jgi:hypothetical protein
MKLRSIACEYCFNTIELPKIVKPKKRNTIEDSSNISLLDLLGLVDIILWYKIELL